MVFGYYAAEGSCEIEHEHEHEHDGVEPAETHEGGGPEFSTSDPDGWTDLWLTGKVRLYRGSAGQFAIYTGLKFPVGDDRVINSAGERIEPAATPGSGAWDVLFGAAATVALAPGFALDASAQFTLRGE